MSVLLQDLETRQRQIRAAQTDKEQKLRSAACESDIRIVFDDYVRRLDVSYDGIVACGSASCTIFLACLETGRVLGRSEDVELQETVPRERLDYVTSRLFGAHDGGGTLAVGISKRFVVDSRRTGGLLVWRIVQNDNDDIYLARQGFVPALETSIVTAVHMTDSMLYVATDTGTVEAFHLDTTELPLTLRTQPDALWSVDAMILSMHVNEELGCIVVTTDNNTVELLTLQDQENNSMKRTSTARFPVDSPTSATLVDCTQSRQPTSGIYIDRPDKHFKIAVGTNDGSLFLQDVAYNPATRELASSQKFGTPKPLMPCHFHTVQCLASPAPGLLLSAGRDGTLRLWDVASKKFLYQFVGYKVWLGSLWTDGERILTDGADNTIILHEYGVSVREQGDV